MRNHRRTALLPFLVLALLAALPAGSALSQGESAVPFLLIAPNSRAAGIGESGVATVDDASAMFWNPAALAFMKGQEVSLTHANWLPAFQQSDLFYDYLTYRIDIPEISGTIGASVTYLSLGKFIKTTSAGPTPVGEFRAYELAIAAGYATRIWDDFALGLNLRFIHSSLSPLGTEQEQGKGVASTVSFDIAAMYRPQTDDFWKRFSAGLNLSNMGPKVTYIDAAQADPLPTNVRLGVGFKIFEDEFNSLQYSLDFSRLLIKRYPAPDSADQANGAVQQPPDPWYEAIFTSWSDGGLQKVNTAMGLEYWYGAPRLIALRFGWFYEDPSFGDRTFLTFGAGIRYDIYGFDFSYISAEENHPLSDTIRFSLLIAWGGV
jgi:hypothetical protein